MCQLDRIGPVVVGHINLFVACPVGHKRDARGRYPFLTRHRLDQVVDELMDGSPGIAGVTLLQDDTSAFLGGLTGKTTSWRGPTDRDSRARAISQRKYAGKFDIIFQDGCGV